MIFMFCIGFFTPGLQCKHRILYTILLIPFIFILNPIRAFCCFLYNIYHLDDFNWIRG
jgi:exosortase/archaeosortase family protein